MEHNMGQYSSVQSIEVFQCGSPTDCLLFGWTVVLNIVGGGDGVVVLLCFFNGLLFCLVFVLVTVTAAVIIIALVFFSV
jgi:hypothetical protein